MLVRVLRRCIPLSLVALAAVEAVILVGAMYLGVAIHHGTTAIAPDTSILPPFPKALVFAALMLAAMTVFGLYRRENHDANAGYTRRSAHGFLASLGLVALVSYVVPGLALGQGVLVLTVVLAFAGHITVRYLFLRLAGRSVCQCQTLLFGSSSRAADVAQLERVSRHDDKFPVVGFLLPTGVTKGVDSSRIVRNGASRLGIAANYPIDAVIVRARDRRCGHTPMKGLLERRLNGAHVIDLPTFFEHETGRVRLESIDPGWLVFPAGFHTGTLKKMGKRLFDLAVAGLLLLLTLPIIALTALAVWLESGRPILCRQARVGAQGRTFDFLKFRSLRADVGDGADARWATENDTRLTRVGRVIRKLRVDELPKLFNVVNGDMSFVGPQAKRPTLAQGVSAQSGHYSLLHAAKPGIVGWARR